MKFDVKKFWDDEAENHKQSAYMYKENDTVRYPFYEVRLERLMEIMSNLEKGKCLDAGCGMAKAMLPFLNSGWEVNGIDSSKKMIDFAKENLIKNNYDPNIVSVGFVEDLYIIEQLRKTTNLLKLSCAYFITYELITALSVT